MHSKGLLLVDISDISRYVARNGHSIVFSDSNVTHTIGHITTQLHIILTSGGILSHAFCQCGPICLIDRDDYTSFTGTVGVVRVGSVVGDIVILLS